ncbi:MAG: MauE/DoxX family redox-associated membrane protein [Acidobacteriota bacterium]
MSVVGTVASILLGAVFLVSGASKIAAGPAWPAQAQELGAPTMLVRVLPWFEIVLGAVLVVQVARTVAAVVALVVLGAFTTLIVRRLAQGRHPPCACFGAWSAKPLGPGHVVRNVGFMALAVLAALA